METLIQWLDLEFGEQINKRLDGTEEIIPVVQQYLKPDRKIRVPPYSRGDEDYAKVTALAKLSRHHEVRDIADVVECYINAGHPIRNVKGWLESFFSRLDNRKKKPSQSLSSFFEKYRK